MCGYPLIYVKALSHLLANISSFISKFAMTEESHFSIAAELVMIY